MNADNMRRKALKLIDNNFMVLTEDEVNIIWNFFSYTEQLEDKQAQINNYQIIIDKINKAKDKNPKIYEEIKNEILEIKKQYNKYKYLFNNKSIEKKFNLNSDSLYTNLNYLNIIVMKKIEDEERRLEILKYLRRLMPYLNNDEYNTILKQVKREKDVTALEFKKYFEKIKKHKIKEFKKMDIENEIMNAKLKLIQYVEIMNEEKPEIYLNILHSKEKTLDHLLFINNYTNNYINNTQK